MTREFTNILKQFDKTFSVEDIASSYGHARTTFTGLNGSSRALFAAALFKHLEKGLIVVTSNNRSGTNLYSDMGHFIPSEQLYLFPSRETLPYDSSEPYRELTTKRIVALDALRRGERAVFVLPVRSFTDLYMPKDQFIKHMIHIRVDMSIDMRQLQEELLLLGYEREEKVSVQGSFAVRGGIVDIYVSGQEHPYRLELFDDVLESLRTFSPVTQRSIHDLESCTVLPAREVFVSPSAKSRLKSF